MQAMNVNDVFLENDNCLTLAVTSGKGGVGKSNLVANLALQLGRRGKKVMVLDADMGMANMDVILGVRPRYTLYHVIEGRKDLLQTITSVTQNVKLIAGGSGIMGLADLEIDRRNRIFESLKKIRQYTDILLIDTGAGLSPNVLDFLQYSNEVLLVSTPEPTSMADAYGIIKAMNQREGAYPEISLVVNRCASAKEAVGVASRMKTVTSQFLHREIKYKGYILEDEHVSKAVRGQKPYSKLYPECKASLCLQKIVDEYSQTSKPSKKKASSMNFIQNFISFFVRGRS